MQLRLEQNWNRWGIVERTGQHGKDGAYGIERLFAHLSLAERERGFNCRSSKPARVGSSLTTE